MNKEYPNNEILVSVIIPIYNAAKTLRRCIDNLLEISMDNIEIILVNDGSTDESLMICNDYKEVDNRIRVISKENEGVSATRNRGILEAKGKYIAFIDSDDYIFSKIYDDIIKRMKNDIDVVFFGYEKEENGSITYTTLNLKSEEISSEQILDRLLDSQFINDFGYVWNKIYRKNIIEKVQIYFETNISEREDLLFNIDVFKNVNKIQFIPNNPYVYSQNDGSLVRKVKSMNDTFTFIKELDKRIDSKDSRIQVLRNNIVISALADGLVKNVFAIYKDKREINKIWKNIISCAEVSNIRCVQVKPLYLKILWWCVKNKNIWPFYLHYRISVIRRNRNE